MQPEVPQETASAASPTLPSSKTIDTLVPDLENLLKTGATPSEKQLQSFSTNLAMSIAESLSQRGRKATLRMSNIGRPCERQLYYEVNSPEEAEELSSSTYMKFMYGHLIEELTLFLVELAGHKVEGRQDESDIEGIKGHRDAVVDGRLLDVKSASSYSFKKFKEGKLSEDDPFGYVGQIQSYLHAGQEDPVITDKQKASFLVIDKTLGHITLDTHEKDEKNWPEIFNQKKEMVQREEPPERAFSPEPMGKSGNLKLPTICSYCDFKFKCHKDANDGLGLRTFLYSNGPVYLTTVKEEPRVLEIE